MSEILIKKAFETSAERVGKGEGAFIEILLGPQDGLANFAIRKFAIEPGGYIEAHRHLAQEHGQYVLEGEMTIISGDREHVAHAGDAVFFPVGAAHRYENRTEKLLRFMCVVPLIDDPKTEWLERKPGGR